MVNGKRRRVERGDGTGEVERGGGEWELMGNRVGDGNWEVERKGDEWEL